jgi:hypothetical protein
MERTSENTLFQFLDSLLHDDDLCLQPHVLHHNNDHGHNNED